MGKLRFLFQVFCRVTTCVVIAVALFTTVINPVESVDPVIMWQIPVVSLMTTLGSLIYPWDRKMGKSELSIRIGAHYLWANLVVLGVGFLFGWYEITRPGSVVSMVFAIAVIYAVASIGSWTKSARDAKQMNEKLKEYQNGNILQGKQAKGNHE